MLLDECCPERCGGLRYLRSAAEDFQNKKRQRRSRFNATVGGWGVKEQGCRTSSGDLAAKSGRKK